MQANLSLIRHWQYFNNELSDSAKALESFR